MMDSRIPTGVHGKTVKAAPSMPPLEACHMGMGRQDMEEARARAPFARAARAEPRPGLMAMLVSYLPRALRP